MYFIKFTLMFIIVPSFAQEIGELEAGVNETAEYRKHYGLSFNDGCANYVKVFKCMSACKSLNYKIYRTNYACKCSCHEMKTSSILPYFVWRTNGTTKKVPKTKSPGQYEVVGSLSPIYEYVETTTINASAVDACGRLLHGNATVNGTDGTGNHINATVADNKLAVQNDSATNPGNDTEPAAAPAAAATPTAIPATTAAENIPETTAAAADEPQA